MGGLISISPIIIKPDFFQKARIFWLVIGSICISIVCALEVFFIWIFVIHEIALELSIIGLLLIVVLLLMFNKVLSSIKIQVSENREDKLNLLGMFSRPKKVTEEEVSVSKEKGICLVCKGDIHRLTYICPKCKTFYCVKCSKALSDMENMCWVCESPFDESKPVKLLEKETDEVVIEEEKQQKK